ncbi:MAG: protein kinase [Planctomycetota bacterium]
MATDQATPESEDRLVELVQRALSERAAGREVDLDELCGSAPQLREEVAAILGLDTNLAAATRAAASTDRALGRRVGGRYELKERLGRGAMGEVFVAHDHELDREVALKRIDSLGIIDDEDRARFLRESRTLAALDHPNVVRIFDRGTDDGALFLVMERLRGTSLERLLRAAVESGAPSARLRATLIDSGTSTAAMLPEGSWNRLIAHWLRDVCRGLAAAHDHGIQHRDVKPSNIMVCDDGRAVLIDFGIAAHVDDPALTAHGSTLGTPWYMPPELARGDARGGPSGDVYSAAATLYHLATLSPPFSGDALSVLAQVRDSAPRPPRALTPDLPIDLASIIGHGMEHQPQHRYTSAAAFADDLDAFLDHRPTSARPLGLLQRGIRSIRRSPLRAAAIFTSLLLALSLGLLWPLWRAQQERTREQRRNELLRTMPALLAIDGQPGAPLVHELSETGGALGALDEYLTLAPDDLPHRLWRAVLALDRGDRTAANADLRAIETRADAGIFSRELCRHYAELGTSTDADGAAFAPSTPPATDVDHFLAGFHELRNRQRSGAAARAEAHLSAAAERYLPARDLRLIALVERGDAEQSLALFERAIEESHWLEGHYGFATARTLAMRGAALIALRRVEPGIAALEESDRLRPDRHGTLHNLGTAYRRRGEIERAIEVLRRAAELRPDAWNTVYMLGLAWKDRANFEEAFTCADRLDGLPLTTEREWRRPELRATVHFRRAVETLAKDPAQAKVDANLAAGLFREAAARSSGRLNQELGVRAQVAVALASDDFDRAVAGFLNLLARTPDDPYQIANLADLVPARDLPATSVDSLRRWLRSLAIRLADGDPKFQQDERAKASATRPR